MKNRKAGHPKFTVFLILTAFFLLLLFSTQCGRRKSVAKTQVILLSIDTLRGDHISPYGYSRDTTPNLSELVNDSTYYSETYPNGCWTMPSHMSLLTGTYPSRHGIIQEWGFSVRKEYPQMNEKIQSIAEIFQHHNVHTIKYANLPDELGFDRGYDVNKRFDPFFDEDKFRELLEELTKIRNDDFFFFVHTWMVHAPYGKSHFLSEDKLQTVSREDIDNFRKNVEKGVNRSAIFRRLLRKNGLFNQEDCMTLYDSGIFYVDTLIGRLIEKTKELGIYDEMMFILVSDHGEHFAEHYPREFYGCHGQDFYEEFIKVPLIIKYPLSQKKGMQTQPVALIDVVPTILEYYAIKKPDLIQGDSLLKPYSKRNRQYLISEAVSLKGIERKMIRVDALKYILTMQDPTGAARTNWHSVSDRRLYDVEKDPKEKKNLYDSIEYRKVCNELEKTLITIIKSSAEINTGTKMTPLNKETLEHLKSLGYLK